MFNSFQNNTTQTTPPPPTITITTKMTNMNNRFASKFDRMNSLRRQQHNDEDENSHPNNIVTPANSNDVDDNNDYEDDDDVTTTATTTTTTTTTITPSSSPTDIRRFVEVPVQAALQLCDDIYAPLMPEEADDNQLAEFFTGLDVSPFLNDDDDNDNYNDQSDQHQQQFNNNTSISTIEQMDVVVCHGTKRRKLSQDEQAADSSVSLCSSASASAYTVDTYNEEDDETKFVLQRKQQLFVRE